MKTPLITTIITTYKRPKLLKRAVESVLSQTYPSFQVCVYDNASGDETAEVVAELQKKDSRVKYHCHPQNIGMMANYEHALSQVKTPFFSLLSDDDLVLPKFYEIALQGFEKDEKVVFSAGATVLVNEKGDVIDDPVAKWENEGCYNAPKGALEMIGKWLPPPGILFRKQVLEGVSITSSHPLIWDCDFLMQIAARSCFFISKEPCAIFFYHAQSFSVSQSIESWRKGINAMIDRVENDPSFAPIRQDLIDKLSVHLKNHTYSCIRHYILWKKFEDAYRAVGIYNKEYGMDLKTLFLAIVAKTCHYFPWAYYLVILFRKFKSRLKIEKKLTA